MTPLITGLHHVTAIASDPQRNLDFYVGTLGLRLVKRTINFDDPGTYHFYFGDAVGTPGTILTFFPWPGARPGTRGSGEVAATAFSIPADSVPFWLVRLKEQRVLADRAPERFGEEVIRLRDPDGMPLELVASRSDSPVETWDRSTVTPEHALRGFHGVTAALEGYERTARILTDVFGYRLIGEQENRFRFQADSDARVGTTLDLLCIPDGRRATGGAGSVHHIAFRARDDAEQLHWREKIVNLGLNVSPVMDRTYFRSIYFREPGGILFEIATDAPGFALDEPSAELGEGLRLPTWLEATRSKIEGLLPPITLPVPTQRP